MTAASPDAWPERRLRVAIAAADPERRQTLAAVIAQAGHQVVELSESAEVVLAEGASTVDGDAPLVTLGGTDTGQAGLLAGNAAPGQIDAALRAAAAGLTVRTHAAPQREFHALSDEDAPLLTPREIEVLAAIGDGLSNKQVARRLGISQHTVKFHIESLFRKLGAASRADAVHKGLRQHLIEL